MIALYKDGDQMAIVTDCKSEEEFLREMSELLAGMIHDGHFMTTKEQREMAVGGKNDDGPIASIPLIDDVDIFSNDWQFQFDGWLPQIVEICCKYRGYKADIQQRILYSSGSLNNCPAEPIASIGSSV